MNRLNRLIGAPRYLHGHLATHPATATDHEPDLTVQPWLEDELVVVVAADDPIVPRGRKGQISLDALRKATWLLREEGSGTREIIHQLLIPHLHHLRPGIEFGNPEAIKRAVAGRLGISCLSRSVVADLLKTGALVAPPTELPRLTRGFYLVMHEQKKRTRGLDLLIRHLEELKNRPAGSRSLPF